MHLNSDEQSGCDLFNMPKLRPGPSGVIEDDIVALTALDGTIGVDFSSGVLVPVNTERMGSLIDTDTLLNGCR